MSVTINHQTNSVEPSSGDLSIGGSGNVGIGTTQQAHKLSLEQSNKIGWVSTVGTDKAAIEFSGTDDSLRFYNNTGSTERMRIDSNGNVGINGTPSASDGVFKLIQIGGSNKYATFGAQANGGFAALMGSNFYYNGGWKRTDAGRVTKIETGPDSSSEELFSFKYAGDGAADSAISWSEAMRIDSNGTAVFSGSIMSKDDSSSASGIEGGELILRAGSDANQTKRVALDNYNNKFRVIGQNDSDGTSGYVIFSVPNGIPLYSNTSGAAANLGVASSGEIYRSTSSRRYKNTITDATHGLTELLTLRPVTYKGNSTGDTIFGGFIAEEVHEAGLTEFVDYLEDENGDAILDGEGNPQADAIHYANMVSICIKAIQEQQETITALEARVVALEAN